MTKFGIAQPVRRVEDRRPQPNAPTTSKPQAMEIQSENALVPLAERCGRVMREALATLDTLRAAPSQAVERSKPFRLPLSFG